MATAARPFRLLIQHSKALGVERADGAMRDDVLRGQATLRRSQSMVAGPSGVAEKSCALYRTVTSRVLLPSKHNTGTASAQRRCSNRVGTRDFRPNNGGRLCEGSPLRGIICGFHVSHCHTGLSRQEFSDRICSSIKHDPLKPDKQLTGEGFERDFTLSSSAYNTVQMLPSHAVSGVT